MTTNTTTDTSRGSTVADTGPVERVNPTTWSQAFGYDQGRLYTRPGAILTIAGQGSIDADGRLLHEGDVTAQLALTIAHVTEVLAEAGMTLANLAQLRIHTTDIDAVLGAYDSVIAGHLTAHGATPPTTLVEVTRLAIPGMAVEIDGLAIR